MCCSLVDAVSKSRDGRHRAHKVLQIWATRELLPTRVRVAMASPATAFPAMALPAVGLSAAFQTAHLAVPQPKGTQLFIQSNHSYDTVSLRPQHQQS